MRGLVSSWAAPFSDSREGVTSIEHARGVFELGQLAIAVELMHDAVVVYDQDAQICIANDRILAATGYTRDELVGQHVLSLMPTRLRNELTPRLTAYIENPVARAFGDGLEGAFVRKDGSTFAAQIANAPIRSTHGQLVVISIRDVENLSLDEIRFVACSSQRQTRP